MEAVLELCRDGRLPNKLRGRDDADKRGFIAHSILERLSAIVKVVPGLDTVAAELKAGTFNVVKIPRDGGPDWEDYITSELMDCSSANCLDVAWL